MLHSFFDENSKKGYLFIELCDSSLKIEKITEYNLKNTNRRNDHEKEYKRIGCAVGRTDAGNQQLSARSYRSLSR